MPSAFLLRFQAVLLLVLLPSTLASAQPRVAYELSFPNRVHHEAEISVTFSGVPAGEPLEVRMSRTSPGRYALHEFAKNVYNVRVYDGAGRALAFTRPDLHGWDVSGHDGTVRFTYTLFGDRADGTYTGIDNTHAHLNIPATLVWARGMEEAPVQAAFRRPEPSWRIATQLFPTSDPEVFTAPGMQYLMDSPTEVSAHALRSWPISDGAERYTMRLAVHHAGTDEQVDAFAEMTKQVVAEQIAVFGEPPRFDGGTYTFIADYLPYVHGDGMEHRNSTILTSTRPLAGAGALLNLGTVSHEFFHAWNVERIRPASLEPFEFEDANVSEALWFAEGFTTYYTPLFIRRAGLTTDSAYAQSLAGSLNYVLGSPGYRYFSPVEMSRQAPFVDAAVSIDPTNRHNTFISYYVGGSLIGLGLDLTLRARYGKTLDELMRAMWVRHGKPERPYTMADIERALAEVSGDAAFAAQFFDRYVEGQEVLDYAALLANAGFLLRRAHPGRATLGGTLAEQDAAVVVEAPTRAGTPLYEAGLDRGDRILTLGGTAVETVEDVNDIVAAGSPGDALPVTFEQRGERKQATLVLTEDPTLEVIPYEQAGIPLTEAAERFRAAWLGSRQ